MRVNADGSLGPRNDVRVVSLERKLGIHGSPTCVMAYGDDDGAVGELVGEVHGGEACPAAVVDVDIADSIVVGAADAHQRRLSGTRGSDGALRIC